MPYNLWLECDLRLPRWCRQESLPASAGGMGLIPGQRWATKSVHHNTEPRALTPQAETTEAHMPTACLCNKRSHCDEKPAYCNKA